MSQPAIMSTQPRTYRVTGAVALTQAVAFRVRILRQERGLNQVQLSKRSGIHQTQVSRLEAGIKSGITLEQLYALAAGLDVPVRELLP